MNIMHLIVLLGQWIWEDSTNIKPMVSFVLMRSWLPGCGIYCTPFVCWSQAQIQPHLAKLLHQHHMLPLRTSSHAMPESGNGTKKAH